MMVLLFKGPFFKVFKTGPKKSKKNRNNFKKKKERLPQKTLNTPLWQYIPFWTLTRKRTHIRGRREGR